MSYGEKLVDVVSEYVFSDQFLSAWKYTKDGVWAIARVSKNAWCVVKRIDGLWYYQTILAPHGQKRSTRKQIVKDAKASYREVRKKMNLNDCPVPLRIGLDLEFGSHVKYLD